MPAITSCKRQLNDTATADPNGISETVYYLVTVNDAKVTPAVAATLPFTATAATDKSMPQVGDDHGLVSGIGVTKKQAKRAIDSKGKPSMFHWIVQVDYGVGSDSGGGFVVGNTNKSKNIRIDVQGNEQAVFTQVQENADKTPIINSVGDLYPDPIEKVLYDEMIVITFESVLFNMALASESRGLINASAVNLSLPQGNLVFNRSFAKHTLRLAVLDYGVVTAFGDPTAHSWEIKLGLAWRKDTWDEKLPQKGFRYYYDVEGVPKLTEWKESAVYLDAQGYKLEQGSELVTTDPIQRYTEGDLSNLLGGI